MSNVLKTVTPRHWIEMKYEGRTYLVAVRSLFDAYIMRNVSKEKEDGKSNDESTDGTRAGATE